MGRYDVDDKFWYTGDRVMGSCATLGAMVGSWVTRETREGR